MIARGLYRKAKRASRLGMTAEVQYMPPTPGGAIRRAAEAEDGGGLAGCARI